tara:strand:- start:1140 stop:1943 length:804 start_codon:yes stop_codon:yes gene_type:complete
MNQFDGEFMCGSYFKSLCKYSVQEYTDARNHKFCFKIHREGDPTKVFCKTEYLNHFLHNFSIEYPFDLLTHNSDVNIEDGNYANAKILQPNLRYWHAQNLNVNHEMMRVLPIGLANPKWKHGNQQDFEKVVGDRCDKNNSLDVCFDLYTNPPERQRCLDAIKVPMRERLPFYDHLKQLKSSFFCISPDGNGIDCHRHWEALYLKTIPIVTRSIFTEKLKEIGLPIVVIEDWADFQNLELSSDFYLETWKDFDLKVFQENLRKTLTSE